MSQVVTFVFGLTNMNNRAGILTSTWDSRTGGQACYSGILQQSDRVVAKSVFHNLSLAFALLTFNSLDIYIMQSPSKVTIVTSTSPEWTLVYSVTILLLQTIQDLRYI